VVSEIVKLATSDKNLSNKIMKESEVLSLKDFDLIKESKKMALKLKES